MATTFRTTGPTTARSETASRQAANEAHLAALKACAKAELVEGLMSLPDGTRPRWFRRGELFKFGVEDLAVLCFLHGLSAANVRAANTIPPAPSLVDAIRTARGRSDHAAPPARLNADGVPEPPDLAAAITRMRRGR